MQLHCQWPYAKAVKTRDVMLGKITDVKSEKKAQLLADAAIAGVKVKKVKANLTAASETAACDEAYATMKLNATVGACDVSAAAFRRHLLVDAAYLVEILLSSAEINQTTIDAALSALSDAGVPVTLTDEDALAVLATVAGVDSAVLTTLTAEAGAAVSTAAAAKAADTVAKDLETAAAAAESDAKTLETAADTLATVGGY
jgi:hypothetical protein